MDRERKFYALKEHAWFGRSFAKLKPEEIKLAVAFIHAHTALGHLEFEYAVNRMFLDRSDKPKNAMLILEALIACNTPERV